MSAMDNISDSFNRRSENVVVKAIIVPELELRNVKMQIFLADIVECADNPIVSSGSDAIHVSASGAMDCFAWLAMTKLDQRVRQNRTTGKSPKACQAPFKKIFRYACRANQWLKSARLTANEGRLEIVTNVR